MKTDILIVGGGLAGLSVADQLHQSGREFILVEAADRLGGRILCDHIDAAAFDMGPAWFWPDQPRIAAAINRFDLKSFEQYSIGALMFQDQNGEAHPNRGYSSMQGSFRVDGGLEMLTAALARDLPEKQIFMPARAVNMRHLNDGIEVDLRINGLLVTVSTNHVVFAAPPRVVAETIAATPNWPENALAAMQEIPTWMAGHAKIVAVYDEPHWRTAGFSGDAMSQKGPMVEIHDASPASGGPYALFGFVGFPPDVRAAHENDILTLAQEQLVALFGPEMARPVSLKMVDWTRNEFIATARDHVSPVRHPDYGMPHALRDIWDGRIIFASTEVGAQFGGFLEGALEAAEAAVSKLMGNTPS